MGFLSNLLGCDCDHQVKQHVLASAALTEEEMVHAVYDFLKAKKRILGVDYAHYKDHTLNLTGSYGVFKLEVKATPSYDSSLPASGVING